MVLAGYRIYHSLLATGKHIARESPMKLKEVCHIDDDVYGRIIRVISLHFNL